MSGFKIDLNIKLEGLSKELEQLGTTIVNDLKANLKAFSRSIYNEGLRLADERLKTTGAIWKNNFKFVEAGPNIYEIYLVEGSPAQSYEDGYAAFDMKPGFLNGPKSKTSKKGTKYADIPLNQKPYAKSSASPKVTDMSSAVKAVLSDNSVSKRIEEFNAGSKGLNKFGQVTKFDNVKDPKVQGLINIKTPEGVSKFLLFRRVSSNSPSGKWIHPGFQGSHILDDLEKFTKDGIEDIFKKILK